MLKSNKSGAMITINKDLVKSKEAMTSLKHYIGKTTADISDDELISYLDMENIESNVKERDGTQKGIIPSKHCHLF